MSSCCFCFGGSRSNNSRTLSQTNPSEHYQLVLGYQPKALSAKTAENLSPGIDAPLENATDSSTAPPHSNEPRHSFSSANNSFYFPSSDPFRPMSALVQAQSAWFDVLLEIETSSEWDATLKKNFGVVMVRNGSRVNSEVPLMMAMLDLEICAEPEDLYAVIYDYEIRKKWDSSIGEYREVKREGDDVITYYMHNKAPWPFADRDFVETRFIRKRENGDMEIFFRGERNEDYPEFRKIVRGETVFGGQIFRKRVSNKTGKETLIVTTICQADMKGDIPPKALKVTFPINVIKWFKSVKKQLNARIVNRKTIL
jgi:hypothetical protein